VCLNPDGSINNSFQTGSGFDEGISEIVAYNNSLLISGGFDTYDGTTSRAIILLNPDGSIDNSFTSPITSTSVSYISNICLQSDNKIIAGGSYNLLTTNTKLGRLLPDGSQDPTFTHLVAPSVIQRSSAISSDGRVVFGGSFNNVNGNPANNLAALEVGSVSPSSLTLSFDNILNLDCLNSNGQATASANGGLPPYQFNWSNSGTPQNALQSFVNGGMKTCTLTDDAGTSTTASLFLTSPTSFIDYDLNIHEIAGEFRPGFDVNIWLDAQNHGCLPMGGQVTYVLDSFLTFVSATPPPNTIVGDTLIWDYTPLYYDSTHFMAQLFLSTSTSAQIGDSIHTMVKIDPINSDFNPSNNEKDYFYPIENGYDPNDKNVYPQGKCPEKYVQQDEDLTYTIRFQNTGNSEAINITVIDTIDASLDISTVELLASSHEVELKALNGNILEFKYDGILLPDSTSNEPSSHGYAIFKIQPNSNTVTGTSVENKVEIYFDFNPAIVTNTTMNTIFVGNIDSLQCGELFLEEKSAIASFKVYPNPFRNELFLTVDESLIGKQVTLIDMFGKVMFTRILNSTDIVVNTKELSSGLYLIRVDNQIERIIRQ
jgi:uncharacterized repeat protein (TIGR01451 family)